MKAESYGAVANIKMKCTRKFSTSIMKLINYQTDNKRVENSSSD